MEITKNKRSEIENEYLALLIRHNQLINITQIKPEWLCDKKSKRMLKYALECYKEFNCFNITEVVKKHNDFDFDYYVELLDDTITYSSSIYDHLKSFEESIVKYYKEDVIRKYNEKLMEKKINYDQFIEVVEKLNEIQLVGETKFLTKEEILNEINDEKRGIKLNGFSKLNKTLKMVQNDFLIIGATTGAGKSGFLLNLMNSLMYEYQCIYFNMEMSKSTIYKRIVSIKTGIPMDYINNPRNDNEARIIDNALNNVEKAGLIIEHRANDIKQIKSVICKLKDNKRHTILFVDHLGLCKCDGMKSLYEQATEVAKQLRQICLEYDCTIISASQLNRGAYGNDNINLSMLKDSGELENSASKVCLLYRTNKNANEPDEKTLMDLEIAKNRDGICGVVKMTYDKTKQIFNEIY